MQYYEAKDAFYYSYKGDYLIQGAQEYGPPLAPVWILFVLNPQRIPKA